MAPPPTPTNPPPPPMGVPGVSAFRPFVRRPPPPRGPSSSGQNVGASSSSGVGGLLLPPGASSSGVGGLLPPGFGFRGIPVGGAAGGGSRARIRIGPAPPRNKERPILRLRHPRPVALPPPPPPPRPPKPPAEAADGEERPVPFVCTVCGRIFGTAKALFGHMRSHPERGWRGALPPPVFIAAEELAALNPIVLNSGPGVGQVPAPGGGGEEPAAPQDQGGAEVAAPQEQAGGEEAAAPQEHGGDQEAAAAPQEEQGGAAEENEEEAVKYLLPDLNMSPPPEN